MKDLQKWIRIRKDLYRQMEAQVKTRLGGEDLELGHYRREYEREFNKKWHESTREALFDRLYSSRLVLMGDFHALQQSQKTHLRILKNFESSFKIHSRTPKPFVLCLECFDADDQSELNRYMNGKLSEKEFLKAIQWGDKWGFPWEHFRPLLQWAQSKKIPVYGINKSSRRRSAASLKARDAFAGQKLHTILKAHPEAVVFAIYGDMHLAKGHIPKQVLKHAGSELKGQIFRLFQNSEKIYFQLLERGIEASVDIVELTKDAYCLLNVPPWVKWQTYLMYLEQTYDLGLEDDDDDDTDNALDFTDQIGAYIKIISEELGMTLSYDDLSVYTAEDESFWPGLQDHFNAKELTAIEDLIEEEISFFLPTVGMGYLARPTVNHAATLAAKYVHAKASGLEAACFLMPRDFLRQIWHEGIGYFGSKIINHKRKTDTVVDLRMALASRGSTRTAKEPLMLALSQKMAELVAMAGRDHSRSTLRPKRKSSYLIASRLLGGMMGERLYGAYQNKLLSPDTLRQFLKKNLMDENFQSIYYEMIEVIESLPAPFRSKKERI